MTVTFQLNEWSLMSNKDSQKRKVMIGSQACEIRSRKVIMNLLRSWWSSLIEVVVVVVVDVEVVVVMYCGSGGGR
jgi:hypothetical protein